MANSVAARPAGYTGIEVHGQTIRVDFMYKSVRHRHTLGVEPTKVNIKHAAGLQSATLFAQKSGNYDEADYFPNSRPAETTPQTSERLDDLCDRYKPLKAVDITPQTQSRYETALNVCLDTIGRNRLIATLLPADIPQLRVDLIATRAVFPVNHYLATFSGFLHWCENNGYCNELGMHCTRFTKSNKDPDPLVKVYGRWTDSESPRELERIWAGMQNIAQIAPNLPQDSISKTQVIDFNE